jgi:plastocyanin
MINGVITTILSIAISICFITCGTNNAPDSEESHGSTMEFNEIAIKIHGGEVSNHQDNITVMKGENVRLVFNSDQALVVHLHGYDLEKTVPINEEVVMEFWANATGRFVITSHSSHDTSHSSHDIGKEGHAELFESDSLLQGDTFEYVIPTDMKDMTIPYHDHMSHNLVGSIVVSPHHVEEHLTLIKISEEHRTFEPAEVMVKPGAIVRWENNTNGKVRITSGNPPGDSHNGHSKNEDDEKTLIALEVRP